MKGFLIIAVLLFNFCFTDAYEESKLCYILDGILVVYAFILTFLYFRLRIDPVFAKTNKDPRVKCNVVKPPAYVDGLYAELTPHNQDTYETI